MKNVLVILLSFVSLLPAMVVCYDLDEYDGSVNEIAEIIKQNAYDENYRDCISKGGAGSTFTMQTPQFVKSCAGFSGSTKGYLKFQFGCDYCTGKKMDDKLKAIEEDCKNGCMESVAYCQKPDLI